MENKEIEKEEKIKKLYDEYKELKKESANTQKEIDDFGDIALKAMKDIFIEEIEIHKFIIKQDLKNVDVILDILKLATSLSISIFVASLTTTYFNERIDVIIYINVVSIILLTIFISIRNSISLEGKKILLEILKKSTTTTCNNMLTKGDGIQSRLNDNKKKLRELKNKKIN